MEWLKKIKCALRGAANDPEVREEVRKRAEIAEEILFGKADIAVSEKAVEMTAKLVGELCAYDSCVVDVGILVFLKYKDDVGVVRLYSKRLTPKERSHLNSNPGIIENPAEMLSSFDLTEIERARAEALRSKVSNGVDELPSRHSAEDD